MYIASFFGNTFAEIAKQERELMTFKICKILLNAVLKSAV
jgi:hypothetical protein